MFKFEGMKRVKWFFIGFILVLASCNLPDQQIKVFSISYLFFDADEGWKGDFADYPQGDSIAYELFYKPDTLPENLNANATIKALHISGDNGSDDLFMFVKKKISGLRPNTTYLLLFNVRLASNARTGAVGVGGPPGRKCLFESGSYVD